MSLKEDIEKIDAGFDPAVIGEVIPPIIITNHPSLERPLEVIRQSGVVDILLELERILEEKGFMVWYDSVTTSLYPVWDQAGQYPDCLARLRFIWCKQQDIPEGPDSYPESIMIIYASSGGDLIIEGEETRRLSPNLRRLKPESMRKAILHTYRHPKIQAPTANSPDPEETEDSE